MTIFENFKLKNIDELVDWIVKYCAYGESLPYWSWFDENYCNKCEPIKTYVGYLQKECECAWCEVNGKCKFFKEMDDTPDIKQIIKMWLESEVEQETE